MMKTRLQVFTYVHIHQRHVWCLEDALRHTVAGDGNACDQKVKTHLASSCPPEPCNLDNRRRRLGGKYHTHLRSRPTSKPPLRATCVEQGGSVNTVSTGKQNAPCDKLPALCAHGGAAVHTAIIRGHAPLIRTMGADTRSKNRVKPTLHTVDRDQHLFTVTFMSSPPILSDSVCVSDVLFGRTTFHSRSPHIRFQSHRQPDNLTLRLVRIFVPNTIQQC